MPRPLTRNVDPLTGYLFGVEVEGIVRGYFNECSGVTAEVKVESWDEGGLNDRTRKFPGRANFGNVTLKRGLTDDDSFVAWFLDVSKGKKLRKTVTVTVFSSELQCIQNWTLHNAFPAKYSIPSLQSSANGVVIESIEFVHEGITA
jgi:phage tail-like protein